MGVYGFIFAGHDLYRVYQPGSAGFPGGLRLAGDARGAGRAGFLCRDHHHDHRRRHHRLLSVCRPAYQKTGRGSGDGPERPAHRPGSVRLFHLPHLPALVPVGRALRLGRRGGGRGAEQLCGAALHLSPYELAALLLGSGSGGEPLYHELLPNRRAWMACRLSGCFRGADNPDGGFVPHPTSLEAPGWGGCLGGPGGKRLYRCPGCCGSAGSC